jgi:hypothetical protein
VFGKDMTQRSLLFLSFKVKMSQDEVEEFMELFEAMVLILRAKACIPGYLETFSLFVDMEKSTFSSNCVKKV